MEINKTVQGLCICLEKVMFTQLYANIYRILYQGRMDITMPNFFLTGKLIDHRHM